MTRFVARLRFVLAEMKKAYRRKIPVTGEMNRTTWMRNLCKHGVTHFVMSDELYEQMLSQLEWQNANAKLGEITGPMTFRGRRILRQADLEHLPFDASPSLTPRAPVTV